MWLLSPRDTAMTSTTRNAPITHKPEKATPSSTLKNDDRERRPKRFIVAALYRRRSARDPTRRRPPRRPEPAESQEGCNNQSGRSLPKHRLWACAVSSRRRSDQSGV